MSFDAVTILICLSPVLLGLSVWRLFVFWEDLQNMADEEDEDGY